MTMKAAILTQYNHPFDIQDVPLPTPGPGEILVKVKACGVCGSDRFLQKGGFDSVLPIIPGHEAAGEIIACDENTGLSVGQRGALYYIRHCGQCKYCQNGQENICVSVSRMGVDFNGAMAEYVTVPSENFIPIADTITFAEAAVTTDAIGTPLHALRRAKVRSGEWVLVIGIGGIGINAVMTAKTLGCRVMAVTRSEAGQNRAIRLGADFAFAPDSDSIGKIRDITGGLGTDTVLQCAPAEQAFTFGLDCLAKFGRFVIVGTCQSHIPFNTNQILWNEHHIIGSRGFTIQDIKEALNLVETGQITLDHLTKHLIPLEHINQGIRNLDNPDISRSIIIPGDNK